MATHPTAQPLVNIDHQSTHYLREQLISEITRLERQLEQLRVGDNNRDYSLQQTYREMIHSRRGMLASLPPQYHC
ncbi:hypothetical protein [Pseudomaricurvus sp. HS19]|uniref:hypothetical protein n=1 Tax=Pseudomaricurvus sp. HS19 TaxID=2692626 RepID=UPI001370D22E|nr:hypothetical protein [Pseudomaricurvus sp. HS19]MYM63680.1 hypothetical protein [Pseudomaricurvus sp. HS19]